MTAPTPHASAHLVPQEAAVAPHPKSPDNVLLALCTRCQDRMAERIRVVTDDSAPDPGAGQEETDGARIRDLWWADLHRIRKIHSQTVAGALAKYQIAKSVYEWSSGLDLSLAEFLAEAGDEVELRLNEASQAEVRKSAEVQKPQPIAPPRSGLLHRLFSMF